MESPDPEISWLHYYILTCLGLQMGEAETAALLAAEYNVPVAFTESVWETLEAAVPELFMHLVENEGLSD